ncbi:MAG: energy-coupling factor transporter transmembrane protein EcfT, partial [Propionibacteriaceae bacterium]|nr:energy-coupling factor transporter transmembrane protein EcfT [Propionibacteriaceae bacterium]
VERWPVGVKYVGLVALGLPAFVARQWPITLAALGLTAIVLLLARLGPRRALGVSPGFACLLGFFWAVNGLTDSWLHGAVIAGNLMLALWVSRLVTLTTPAPDLIDALVAATRPLRRFGFDPERFGLAVMVMLRSIPHLAGQFARVREAAAARGLGRRLGPQATQVVVGAVAYAHATGDAMAARGLGDG